MQKSSTALTATNCVRIAFKLKPKEINYSLKTFWHIEVWLEPEPHWFVPDCPCSVVGGTFDGKYVALYVCARTIRGSARATRAVVNIAVGVEGAARAGAHVQRFI